MCFDHLVCPLAGEFFRHALCPLFLSFFSVCVRDGKTLVTRPTLVKDELLITVSHSPLPPPCSGRGPLPRREAAPNEKRKKGV